MQKACIVIPCYNESNRLDLSIFNSFIKNHLTIDFLFVNDGSSDNTLDLLEEFKNDNQSRVIVLNLNENSGKAEAVRQGVLEVCKNTEYEYVGFWDADLATPLSEIINFLRQIENDAIKIAIGSRMKRLGAKVERKFTRHILGRIFSTFSSIILRLPVYDTQCGAKLFHTDLVYLFEDKFITSWLFDIELLARYRNKFGVPATMTQVLEVPVNEWIEKGDSRLKLKHMLKVPFELINISRKYN